MKLYQITYLDDEDRNNPDRVKWVGTQSDSKREFKQLKVDGMRNIKVESKEVPTSKEALLAFLNDHQVF